MLRPSNDADLGAILDITQRHHRAVTGRPHSMTAVSAQAMRDVPGRAFPVVCRDGQVLAYGGIFAFAPYSEIFVLIHVDPDIDDATLERCTAEIVTSAEEEAIRLTADLSPDPTRVLATDTLQDDARVGHALADLGFAVERNTHEMVIDLTGRDLVPLAWPASVQVRRMRVPEDVEDISALFLDAFLDHQGDLPFTADVIGHVLRGADARLDVSAVAFDADGPVGGILCRQRPDHGYVWVLGVRRRGRRQGLAEALLTHAFTDFAATGTTTVVLEVEAQSLTGATRLYERTGMTVRTVHDTWTRPLRLE